MITVNPVIPGSPLFGSLVDVFVVGGIAAGFAFADAGVTLSLGGAAVTVAVAAVTTDIDVSNHPGGYVPPLPPPLLLPDGVGVGGASVSRNMLHSVTLTQTYFAVVFLPFAAQ